MDPSTLKQLLDVSALKILDSLDYDRSREFDINKQLRAQGLSPELTATILTQAQLREEAVTKFGPFASDMLFTRDGLAQATRLPVAAHHASRMRQAGVELIIDLGCGIGADALAFAGTDVRVRAVDIDETTAAIAAFNLRDFPHAEVVHASAEEQDLAGWDALWCDPARRSGSHRDGQARRLNDPEAFSPSLSWVVEKASEVRAAGVKLGPALDHSLIPNGWEAQWVSHNGDVVEVGLYAGDACQRAGRSALLIGDEPGTLVVHESEVPEEDEPGIGELGEYLFEPDGALVRAGLITALCGPINARRVSPKIAYLTGDSPVEGLAARAVSQYRIVDVLPAGIKALRQALKERNIGKVVIKKRGMDIVPEKVRRQLKLAKGSESATLVFTRVGEKHVVLLTQPVG